MFDVMICHPVHHVFVRCDDLSPSPSCVCLLIVVCSSPFSSTFTVEVVKEKGLLLRRVYFQCFVCVVCCLLFLPCFVANRHIVDIVN